MKQYYIFFGIMLSFFLTTCKKNDSSQTLSNEEKKLLGNWTLKKQIIEESGQPIIINNINSPSNCFVEFKDLPAPLLDQSSPIYSNTKWAQDNKDCTWLLNAWKIDTNGKLLLASLDTSYADIIIVESDTLAFKVASTNNHSILITYEFIK